MSASRDFVLCHFSEEKQTIPCALQHQVFSLMFSSKYRMNILLVTVESLYHSSSVLLTGKEIPILFRRLAEGDTFCLSLILTLDALLHTTEKESLSVYSSGLFCGLNSLIIQLQISLVHPWSNDLGLCPH